MRNLFKRAIASESNLGVNVPTARLYDQPSHATDAESVYSEALSEAETFTQRTNQTILPPTYQDGFASYAPCVIRSHYAQRAAARMDTATIDSTEDDSDDERTMIFRPEGQPIMQRHTTSYDVLRTMVVASEMLLNTMYVFSDSESYERFKKARKSSKKLRNNSASLKSLAIASVRSDTGIVARNDETVSSIDSIQLMWDELPLLKIEVPYMSAFRRKTPYMIFRGYKSNTTVSNDSSSQDSDLLETFEFCSVHLKTFQHYKRYIFNFQPEDGPKFRVIAFQHNYRPFTDFNYKDTRFRVFGTSRSVSYPTFYNPELKLCILDPDQSSLMDDLIEKKDERHFLKNADKRPELVQERDLENPIPSPQNAIIKQIMKDEYSSFYKNSVPQQMPPFAKFLDSRAYLKHPNLRPKKYSELGQVAVYEDSAESQSNERTLPVGIDNLVLATIFLALRETNIRSTVKREDIETY
ncbi:hypothetical protein HF325_003389 [Metschnikowia pulcherrima]|uniref:Uncharacterized protein n=1 Tax=Metschnikowia pulcherrima TaxID=27326 RepID=A0A8H7GRP9_9ASCO|nr:hypothetical protein HF325_003389 [Metschnikowia pulcherrima]